MRFARTARRRIRTSAAGRCWDARRRDGWRIEAAVKAGNTRTDSAHNRYHIAPAELVKIERDARSKGLSIGGFYHSHPDHPAQWSPTDFAEAHWLGCWYVITAVAQGQGHGDQLVPAGRRHRRRQAIRRRNIEVIEKLSRQTSPWRLSTESKKA
jgi:proteasome lid subunit RPN8/RPN11